MSCDCRSEKPFSQRAAIAHGGASLLISLVGFPANNDITEYLDEDWDATAECCAGTALGSDKSIGRRRTPVGLLLCPFAKEAKRLEVGGCLPLVLGTVIVGPLRRVVEEGKDFALPESHAANPPAMHGVRERQDVRGGLATIYECLKSFFATVAVPATGDWYNYDEEQALHQNENQIQFEFMVLQ